MKLADSPELLQGRRTHGFFDDFHHFVSGDLFTDTSADTGAAVAMTDAAGGVVTLTTGATDNNECYLLTTKEVLKLAANKPVVVEARVSYTEANTDDANVAVGLKDAVAADSILDDGGGPAASYSGAVFFKVDGALNWNIEVSIAGTQTTVELTAANSLDGKAHATGAGAWEELRIELMPVSSTTAEARFFIDGVLVYKVADWTFTNFTEAQAFVGVKAGGANSEVVSVDYIAAYGLR